MANFEDNEEIKKLVHIVALGGDRLDWQLFSTCWTGLRPINVDLSNHVQRYSAQGLSVSEVCEMSHTTLSGFDGTHHLIGNIMIDYRNVADLDKLEKESISQIASVLVYVTAYHQLQLSPDAHGDDIKAIMRGTWDIQVQKELVAGWKISNFCVSKMVPIEGNPGLYDLAKKRSQEGKGRKALTAWPLEVNSSED